MNRQTERGFALLLVLWTMALLALLGGQVMSLGSTDARVAFNLRARAAAAAAAQGAIAAAAFHVLAGGPGHWAADGRWHPLAFGSARVRIRLAGEAAQVNPNLAGAPRLAALLRHEGLARRAAGALAAAIVAWRQPGRADLAAYRAAGRARGPAGEPFQSLDDLRFVLGMTADVFAALAPHLALDRTGPGDRGVFAVAIRVRLSGAPAVRYARRAVLRIGAAPGPPALRILSWHRAAD